MDLWTTWLDSLNFDIFLHFFFKIISTPTISKGKGKKIVSFKIHEMPHTLSSYRALAHYSFHNLPELYYFTTLLTT